MGKRILESTLDDSTGIKELYDSVAIKSEDLREGTFKIKGGMFYTPTQEEIDLWIESNDHLVLVLKDEDGTIIGYSSAILNPTAIRNEFDELIKRFGPDELDSIALWRDSIIHPNSQKQGLAKLIEFEILGRLCRRGKVMAIGEIYTIKSVAFADGTVSHDSAPNIPAIEARKKFHPTILGDIEKNVSIENIRVEVLSQVLKFDLEDYGRNR